MSLVRWLGLFVGALVLLWVFNSFRRGRARRLDFVLGFFFSVSIITVSAFPEVVNSLREMLALEEAQFSRLIAILIVSNLFLWLLLFYTRFRQAGQADKFDVLVRQLGVAEFRRLYPETEKLPPIAVIIPAYNEEDNIGLVLYAMPKEVCGEKLATIVVDDGSQDGTIRVARQHDAFVVPSPMNRGGGAALRLGFDISKAMGAKIVVTMDADGQHLPEEIERLVKPILDREQDFVIGSRLLGEREKDSAVRLVGIHVFNFVIRMLTGVKITDCSNGFRAFRVSELSKVLLRQDQFHTSELIIDASKKGIRIGEAPITVKRRHSGESKKGKNLSYGFNFAKTIMKTWWR